MKLPTRLASAAATASTFATTFWPWPLELLIGVVQPILYHWSLAGIRRWWPWMETKPMVGAVCPPQAAYVAEALRQADKADKTDEHSGT